MANKKTRAIDKQEFELIISTIQQGFITGRGQKIRPNVRIATALVLEANLGLRIGDIMKLKLTDIILENNRYRLNIVEQKTQKSRTFTVPTEIYIYLQNYSLRMGIKPNQRLFNISVRAVQGHLKMVCDYLGLVGVASHSLRKMFAQEIYKNNNYDLSLLQHILQHSSLNVTQHYLSIDSKQVEQALQKHIVLPV